MRALAPGSSLSVLSRKARLTDLTGAFASLLRGPSPVCLRTSPAMKMHRQRPAQRPWLLLPLVLWIFCHVNSVHGALPTTRKLLVFLCLDLFWGVVHRWKSDCVTDANLSFLCAGSDGRCQAAPREETGRRGYPESLDLHVLPARIFKQEIFSTHMFGRLRFQYDLGGL